jgi:hypothetical protein
VSFLAPQTLMTLLGQLRLAVCPPKTSRSTALSRRRIERFQQAGKSAATQNSLLTIAADGKPRQPDRGRNDGKECQEGEESAIQEKGQPMPEGIRLVAVQGKGSLILCLVFSAPSADFGGLRPTFVRILQSIAVRWGVWGARAAFLADPTGSYTPNVAKILRPATGFPDNPLCPFGVQLIRIVRSSTSDRAYNLRKRGPGQGRSSL